MSSSTYESSSLRVHEALSAWFLGPQAENADLLKELFAQAVADNVSARTRYHPEDGNFITSQVKESQVFHQTVENVRKKFGELSTLLNDHSIPSYSPRWSGDMSLEPSLPSIAGWLAGLLLNPNNVSFEAGPITTQLELEVGKDLCKMIGFENEGDVQSWGHLTCGGSVANSEFIWAARNLKFYPLALWEAMKPDGPLDFISGSFLITKQHGERKLFINLSTWELLNLHPSTILSVPDRLQQEYGITPHYLNDTMSKYIVQSTGLTGLNSKWGIEESPKFLVSGTKHYSWPKGIALAGIGSDNLIDVPVDNNARIDIEALRHKLDYCLNNHQAIYAVIATIGSTGEGAVDPLNRIIQLRDEYQARGLNFLIHADAAWGGYFASTLRNPPNEWVSSWPVVNTGDKAPFDEDRVPYIALKQHTVHQLESLHGADSVAVDPHKSGYCPYPAGGLCYRDRRMRHLLTWSAPYIEHGQRGENLGIHGIEGSKAGAGAASVYMHHSVIGLHKRGHGELLGEVSFTCARLAAQWATMSDTSTPFLVVPFNKLRFEPHEDGIEFEKDFIRRKILGRSNEEILQDPDPGIMVELRALGSDLNINSFICNFRSKRSSVIRTTSSGGNRSGSGANPDEWVINEDVEEANYLNQCIFDRLSLSNVGQAPKEIPMFLSATVLKYDYYGECLQHFKRRAGLETESKSDLFVLRNVVTSPFQASADFVEKLALTFKSVLEENMKHVVARNTITPQIHNFIMQGTDKLFLAYRPLFFKANGRQQLILEVAVPNAEEWSRYLSARDAHPNTVFTLSTPPMTISDVLEGTPLSCGVYANQLPVIEMTIANARIIKNRPLLSRWLDRNYDAKYTPFYFYGTSSQQHIDHILLKAPNAQLTAENVTFTSLDHVLPIEKLGTGLLLYVCRPERSLQPFDRDNSPTRSFFYPNAEFKVMVCDDPFETSAHGPGLAAAGTHYPVLARGTIRLPLNVFADSVELNRGDFRDNERITPSRMADRWSWEDQSGWGSMVKEQLHIPQTEVYNTASERKVDGRFNDGHDISRWPKRDSTTDEDTDVRQAGLFPAPSSVRN